MYIIAGLGNPTREYEKTRHNAGFEAVDILADKLGTGVTEKKHKAFYGTGRIGAERVILSKPQTFMNLSGESIRAMADFYKVEPDHIIIICDDINLAEGRLRIRVKGSAGGHNGLKSIISHLGTQEFLRVRVGVGEKPKEMDLADYVLGRFPKIQEELMTQAYKEAAEAAIMIVRDGAEAAMNYFNRIKEVPHFKGEKH
jgi:PTH1 family peptidyl-tRNA hydrolase